MVTVRDEGPICGRQQDEVFLSRDDAVEIFIVVLVH